MIHTMSQQKEEDKMDRYAQRGVSSGKEDVHQAIAHIDKGLFPKAFCKIVPDTLTGSEEHCRSLCVEVVIVSSFDHLA